MYLALKSLFRPLHARTTPDILITHGAGTADGASERTFSLRDLNKSFWQAAFFGGDKDNFTGCHGEHLIEGGLLWLARLPHNDAYEQLTDPVHNFMSRLGSLTSRDTEAPFKKPFYRLVLLLIVHRRIARYYYTDLYLSSGDMAAFREYIYHRVSFLRDPGA